MSPNEALSYEVAVYVEDVTRMAAKVADLITADLGDLPDRIRVPIAAAILASAAQTIDGIDVAEPAAGPALKERGATGCLARIAIGWVSKS